MFQETPLPQQKYITVIKFFNTDTDFPLQGT
jgi:hypothetical protein